MTDKTSYAQSLMHMIKGNLGTGILAMPASFAHTGLINAVIGLPILCLISTYCVHLLVKSCQHIEGKTKGVTFKYASLATYSFNSGPKWMSKLSSLMCSIVDGTLLVAQLGVCCVYLVFVVDNITSILASYNVRISKTPVFFGVLPVALLLSYIKTLKRLAIASAGANLLQAVGISIILEYLARDISKVNMSERENFMPFNQVALGFGSAMFAFEGISVVLPVYGRMKNPNRMSGFTGVVNVSYVVLLILYFLMGLFGFLKFGHEARDSITLNLPPEPLYDAVRGLFAISVILTYPLQFYVPNEIIWNWAKKNIIANQKQRLQQQQQVQPQAQMVSITPSLKVVVPTIKVSQKEKEVTNVLDKQELEEQNANQSIRQQKQLDRYDYCCRTLVVLFTFVLALAVPKLNLLMDLIGSITGTSLSLIFPALIHMSTFWDHKKGLEKCLMLVVDIFIIAFGIIAGVNGSIFSLSLIINSFLKH